MVGFIVYLVGFIHLESIFYLVSRSMYVTYVELTRRVVLNQVGTKLNLVLDSTILIIAYSFIIFFFKEASYISSSFSLVYFFRYGVIIFILFYFFLKIFALTYKFSKLTNPFIAFICFSVFFFVMFLPLVRSYILLFFFLEVVSVYYYFFFLFMDLQRSHITFIKYKNFIVYYLWNSFLTSIFAGLSLGWCLVAFGSTNFDFLNSFSGADLCSCIFFFFLAFLFKLGVGGFHFLKLELYLYLDIGSIIYFSVISIFINFFILGFFLVQPSVLSFMATYTLAFLVVLFFFSVLFLFVRVNSLPQFFAVSSLITFLNLVCMLML